MAVPKRRHSRARQAKRRTHDRLTVSSLSPCSQCGTVRPSHRVCPVCGTYRGRTLVLVKKEKTAKEAR